MNSWIKTVMHVFRLWLRVAAVFTSCRVKRLFRRFGAMSYLHMTGHNLYHCARSGL